MGRWVTHELFIRYAVEVGASIPLSPTQADHNWVVYVTNERVGVGIFYYSVGSSHIEVWLNIPLSGGKSKPGEWYSCSTSKQAVAAIVLEILNSGLWVKPILITSHYGEPPTPCHWRTGEGATCVYLQALPNNCYYLSLSLQRGSRRAVVAPLSLGHAMFNRAKTESRGGVKWASRIAGEVGGGYSHRQGEVLTCGLLPIKASVFAFHIKTRGGHITTIHYQSVIK
jgi:hypothetical protein